VQGLEAEEIVVQLILEMFFQGELAEPLPFEATLLST
jgi:hypothetical protein